MGEGVKAILTMSKLLLFFDVLAAFFIVGHSLLGGRMREKIHKNVNVALKPKHKPKPK